MSNLKIPAWYCLGGLDLLLSSIALLAISVVGIAHASLRREEAPAADISPAAAGKVIAAGPVFNDFDFGGFIVFRGIPAFSDGRTLPFGPELLLQHADALAAGAASFVQIMSPSVHVCHARPGSPE